MLERVLRKIDLIISGQEEIKESLLNLEKDRKDNGNRSDQYVDTEFIKVRI